jgi:hypothetical protein
MFVSQSVRCVDKKKLCTAFYRHAVIFKSGSEKIFLVGEVKMIPPIFIFLNSETI